MNETLPPPPPSTPPPPPAGPPAGGASDNRNLMLVFAYLGPFALIPWLIEKSDADVQWHAKHGLVLLAAEIALSTVLMVFNVALPFLGCLSIIIAPLLFLAPPLLFLALLILHIVLIMKAIRGERMSLPGLTPFVDKF